MKKFKIHYSFYIVLLFSIFLGLFKEMINIITVLFLHESGHILFLIIFKTKILNITIYPFGGVLNYEQKNDYLYKEVLITIGGILFNLIFYFLFKVVNFKTLSELNLIFVLVNLLPILPLDGGKIFNYLLSIFVPYSLSKMTTYLFSIIISLLFLIYLSLNFDGIYSIFLLLCFIRINIISIFKFNKEYHSFLLLKYLKPNGKLLEKETEFFTYNPIKNLFYARNTIFDFKTFKVKEEVVLKKYFTKK